MDFLKNSENNNQDPQAIRDKQERRKKKVIKGVLIFSAVVILISAIFAGIDPQALAKKWFGEDEQAKEPISFYPLDDPWNFPDNPEYLDMDRRLFVHNPFDGITYSVEESQLPEEDEVVSFFYYYFQAMIHGNVEAFRDMYASDYDGTEEIPDDFTSQMVYDMTLYPQTDGGSVIAYRLDYRIYRNNGTLRSDMGSDTIRPLIFTLTEEDGELKIKSVIPYTSVRK